MKSDAYRQPEPRMSSRICKMQRTVIAPMGIVYLLYRLLADLCYI